MDLFEALTEWVAEDRRVRTATRESTAPWRTPKKPPKQKAQPPATIALLDRDDVTDPIRPTSPQSLWHLTDHLNGVTGDIGFPDAFRKPACFATVLTRWAGGKTQEYRPACLGCGWVGPLAPDHVEAAKKACDHSHPTWREQLVIKRLDGGAGWDLKHSRDDWRRRVAAHYPAGWFESGGPVLTLRTGRAVADIPGGGYDLPMATVVHTKGARPEKIGLVPRPKSTKERDPWKNDNDLVYDGETGGIMRAGDIKRRAQIRAQRADAEAAAARAKAEHDELGHQPESIYAKTQPWPADFPRIFGKHDGCTECDAAAEWRKHEQLDHSRDELYVIEDAPPKVGIARLGVQIGCRACDATGEAEPSRPVLAVVPAYFEGDEEECEFCGVAYADHDEYCEGEFDDD